MTIKFFIPTAIAVVTSTFLSPLTKTTVTLPSSEPLQRTEFDLQNYQRGASEAGPVPPTPNVSDSIVLRPPFKLVFLGVLGITVLSVLLQIALAFVWSQPTPSQQATFESLGFGWKAGLGAIFGLLGGKIT